MDKKYFKWHLRFFILVGRYMHSLQAANVNENKFE